LHVHSNLWIYEYNQVLFIFIPVAPSKLLGGIGR